MMRTSALVCALLLSTGSEAGAYSVLTHEAVIDSAWERNIQPLLLKKFPGSTPDERMEAHASAYGGCIIQDMGYYPFGSKFFSDLVHYVRTGDFVENLLHEAQTLNEYAFALGALAHYVSDTEGHSLAVNRAVALEYPKLERKFGDVVTYEDNPAAHIKTEFGFDVLEVAHGNYAPKAYHDFIGFQVPKPVLERAFRDTYSLELSDVFASVDLALGTYRHTVSAVIPEATRIAWSLKKDDLVRTTPGLTQQKFIYNLSRASYEQEWGDEYEKPGIAARILAFFFRLIPKVGPFKAVAFKAPTAATAQLFMNSFNHTLTLYRKLLAETGAGNLTLADRDLDTGQPTRPGAYRLADVTYAKLARKLAEKAPGTVDAAMRQTIVRYFDRPATQLARQHPKDWRDTVAAVAKLRGEAAR